jgi:HD-like signal output (HDOD) protein
MGITHAAIGGWMTERWRLPPVIVNMVSDHHKPAQTLERRELVASIHMGDIIARAVGIGSGGDQRIPAIDPAVATAFGITASSLDQLVAKVLEEVEKGQEFFSLVANDA